MGSPLLPHATPVPWTHLKEVPIEAQKFKITQAVRCAKLARQWQAQRALARPIEGEGEVAQVGQAR